MPPDFFQGFFQSDPARQHYGTAGRLFGGAIWVPSPLTDASIAGPVQVWWRQKFDAMAGLLDGSVEAKNFLAEAVPNSVDRIRIGLGRLYDQANFGSALELKDKVAALMTAFTDFSKALAPVMRAQQQSQDWQSLAKLTDAAEDLMNASNTAAMSAVASLESDARARRTFARPDFNGTFNELFLRDRAANLYQLVGDLPDGMSYNRQDTPGEYLSQATANLAQGIPELQGLATTIASAENGLAGRPLSADTGTVLRLAMSAQQLGESTERAAVNANRTVTGTREATSAAALSGVVVESLRGVLGVAPHGSARLTQPVSEAALDAFGSTASQRIGFEVARDRQQDPLYPRYNYEPRERAGGHNGVA